MVDTIHRSIEYLKTNIYEDGKYTRFKNVRIAFEIINHDFSIKLWYTYFYSNAEFL